MTSIVAVRGREWYIKIEPMALEDDVKALLVVGNSIAVTISYNPRTSYTGVVEEITADEFELRGDIINKYEHFGNISAEPIYRTHRFNIVDIASIERA